MAEGAGRAGVPARPVAGSPLEVRMEDVARLAEVSRATVSRVIMGTAQVSEHTQDRVRRAMDELGYVPNMIAQGLAGRGSDLVGLLLREPRNPAYGQLHSEVQLHASAAGLQLITAVPTRTEGIGAELSALRRLLGLRVSGLMVATGVITAEHLEPFLDQVPVVSVGRVEAHPRIHAVSYDEEANARLIADAVADAGHAATAVIVPERSVSTAEHVRGTAIAARLEERGVLVHRLPTAAFGDSTTGFEDVARLAKNGSVTAALFSNDVRAVDFLDFAEREGLRVPEDLSVTGLDGVMPGLQRLGLATVRLPVPDVARRSAALMSSLISHGPGAPVVQERLAGEFVPGRTLTG